MVSKGSLAEVYTEAPPTVRNEVEALVAAKFVEVAFVNTPVLGVDAPMVTPLIVPAVKVRVSAT
jgi:hypothetical protein